MAARRNLSIRSRLIVTFVTALALVVVVSLMGTVVALVVYARTNTNLVFQVKLLLEAQARSKQVTELLTKDFDTASLAAAATPQGVGIGLRARVIAIDGSIVYDSYGSNEPLTVREVVAWLPASSGSTVVQQAHTISLWKDRELWGHYVLAIPDFAGGAILGNQQPKGIALLLIIGPITAVLVSSLFFYSFGQRLVKPLRKLSDTVGQIAKGNFEVKSGVTDARDELDSLALDIDRMANRLSQAKQEVDQAQYALRYMVATISHDIRTPLTTILAHSEALEQGVLTPEESHKVIKDRGLQICELVEDLSELTALQSSPGKWPVAPVDISEVIRSAIIASLPEFEQCGMEVEVTLPDSPLVVELPLKQFRRVVDNLLSNARKYACAGAYLAVKACKDKDAVRLEFRDKGPGIAPGELELVFDRFYQSQSSTTFRGGSGLGLAVAREIVYKLGGRIGVTNAKPSGCVFWIELPRNHNTYQRSLK